MSTFQKLFFILFLFSLLMIRYESSRAESRIFDEVVGVDENGGVERIALKTPRVVLSKREIYHFEILNVYLYDISELNGDLFSMRIYKDGSVHPSAGGICDIPFSPERDKNGQIVYRAVYLPDWNEEDGQYEIQLYYGDRACSFYDTLTFILKRRVPPDIKKGFCVVDLEMNGSIKERIFESPDGNRADYRALLQWAKYMQSDAVWILAGETTSFQPWTRRSHHWDAGPLQNLHLLKKEAHEYGLAIGAYIMSFYVPGVHGVPGRYEPAIGYNSEKEYLYKSKHISLFSETRIQDIIELASVFEKDPEIGFIGLDFIRTGRADGYELAPAVVKDTNISVPPGWEELSKDEKIKWFAMKIEVERDPLILEKWRWWRAHRVAEIVQRVIKEAQISKPLFVYTLGWNHGKEHGQDPVMFFDAGVSIDAVMLYEANSEQFKRLLQHWKKYIKEGQGNIIVGNCIDQNLLDSPYNSPPDELLRRNIEGYRNIINNGFASGLFLHDLARGFWGRRGGYSLHDYANAFLSSVFSLKKDLQVIDLRVDVEVDEIIINGTERIEVLGHIYLKNNGTDPIRMIRLSSVDLQENDAVVYFHESSSHINSFEIHTLNTFESRRVDFNLIRKAPSHFQNQIGFKVELPYFKEHYMVRYMEFDTLQLSGADKYEL
jgi:hypothetical protein